MADDRSKRRKVVAINTDAAADQFCLAKDCIKVHLISSSDEFREDGNGFCPEFLEDHFGETGKIFGYRGLKVDIWLHSSSFHAYADVKYDALAPPARRKSHKSLQVVLKEIFGAALVEDRDTFLNKLAVYDTQFSDLLSKQAEKLSSWEAPSNSSTSSVNQIFRLELRDSKAREWHRRLNPLVLWFVEGASCIEATDPRWEVYVAVETVAQDRHKVTGVCNVYRFFHYPDSTRLRISQILVFPPFQKKQYGYQLVKAVNEAAIERRCYDVTMEDPSERLQKLRDCMDVKRLLVCGPVMSQLEQAVEGISKSRSKNRAFLVPTTDLATSVREEVKMSKGQVKRCWEVLLFLHLDPADEAARELFWELMREKTNAEIFEDKEKEEVGGLSTKKKKKLKRVIDTHNEFDSTKTFVMMKFKTDGAEESTAGAAAESSGQQQQEDVRPDASSIAELLNGVLKEREVQIMEVVKKVASLCADDTTVPVKFNKQAWITTSA